VPAYQVCSIALSCSPLCPYRWVWRLGVEAHLAPPRDEASLPIGNRMGPIYRHQTHRSRRVNSAAYGSACICVPMSSCLSAPAALPTASLVTMGLFPLSFFQRGAWRCSKSSPIRGTPVVMPSSHEGRPCEDAMRRTEARRIVPSLSFVPTLRSKEATKWAGRRALRFPRAPFTARWN
jgi:hypothetical protein